MDGLDIAARQVLLWPCHAFSISIPQKKKSGLNVFEETVLRLTEVESGDTAKIAELACLDPELVSFIQSRLRQLNLVDDRNDLSGEGKDHLISQRSDADADVEYAVGTIFLDLHTGKLISYLHMGGLHHESLASIEGDWVTITTGTAGKARAIKCRLVRPDKASHWKAVPGSEDVVKAIREFKRKFKRHALLSQDTEQYPPSVPMAEAISIQPEPELVYLYCEALIQTGNSDLLVTDGCGFGFSETFAGYLVSQGWPWVVDLKSRGVVDRFNSDQSSDEGREEGASADASKKYPLIARSLRRAQEHLSQARQMSVDSSSQEKEFGRLTGLAVVALYEAIEWALRVVVSDNPVLHWERVFSAQSFQANDKMLRSLAVKVGFDGFGRANTLLQVQAGKILALERGIAEMQPLLALAIAGATNDAHHPLHRLAVADSGALAFISSLKEFRDPASHGGFPEVEPTLELLMNFRDRTVRLVRTLIPDAAGYGLEAAAKPGERSDIDQVRYKARVDLDKSLGLAFVHAVAPSLREELVKLTMLDNRRSLDPEQKNEYVVLLASIMQIALAEVVKAGKPATQVGGNVKEVALRRMVETGFYAAAEQIPESIRTVSAGRVFRAVQATGATLGACLLAVFFLKPESDLIWLRNAYPGLVDFVARLTRLRGHGNNQQIDLSREDMASYKANLFKGIKAVMEVI